MPIAHHFGPSVTAVVVPHVLCKLHNLVIDNAHTVCRAGFMKQQGIQSLTDCLSFQSTAAVVLVCSGFTVECPVGRRY